MRKPGFWGRLFGQSGGQPHVGAALAEHYGARPVGIAPHLIKALFESPTLAGYMYDDEDDAPTLVDRLIQIDGSVAVLSLRGPLVHRPGAYWWYHPVSYDEIVSACPRLAANENVTTVVIDADTPGGECSGMLDAADAIAKLAAAKRTIAVINDNAYSAGYGLISGASEIVISRTGGAGSVGVIARHIDYSGAYESMGVNPELIYAGERKADYSETAPLSNPARAALQGEVDRLWGLFIDLVATNRKIPAATVRGWQAAVFFGPNAVTAGAADRIATLAEVLAELGDDTMPTPTQGEDAGNDIDALMATAPEGLDPKMAQFLVSLVQAATAAPKPAASAAAGAASADDDAGAADRIAAAAAAAAATQPGSSATTEPPDPAATAADIVAKCVEAGVPELAADFIRSGAALADVEAAIGDAQQIRDICAAAGCPDKAAHHISSGKSPDAVRKLLMSRAAKADEDTVIHSQNATAGAGHSPNLDPDRIYNKRAAAARGATKAA